MFNIDSREEPMKRLLEILLTIRVVVTINQLDIVFWIILLIVALLMQKDINRVFKSKEINLKKISNHFKNQAIYGGLILGALIIA